MPLELHRKGKCLGAKLTGKITINEVVKLWDSLAEETACGFVDFESATEFPRAEHVLLEAPHLHAEPDVPVAFFCPDMTTFGKARMLISIFGLKDGYHVFTRKDDALEWLKLSSTK